MLIREKQEEWESRFLDPSAARSYLSSRVYKEERCPIRTEYQRDRDRILHSKSFRRLKHKTQVFISPGGDHYRTRLTHTLEVAQISRTIARALKLNEDLAEAIALGHDLGHTPFGHSGEEALNSLLPDGFRHNEQSLRVVEILENHRSQFLGLNLTQEVCHGICCHTGEETPSTLEGQIVKIADRVAYINHDIDDALRAGLISWEDLPNESISFLGTSHSIRIGRMVTDLIEESSDHTSIRMSQEVGEATRILRSFLFAVVYQGPMARKEEAKARRLIDLLFEYYREDEEALFKEYSHPLREMISLEEMIGDYIAGMTDRYALKKARLLLLPRPWLE